MKKRGIVFGFLLSLLAGVILGASGGFLLIPKIFPPPRPSDPSDKNMVGGHPPPLPSAAVQEKIMKRLESKLDLTEEQRTQVQKEVKIFAEELDKFHNSNREELKSMYDAFIARLSKLIPGEKADRLRKISGDMGNPPPPSERRTMQRKDDRSPPPREENSPPDNSDRRPPPRENDRPIE